MPPGAPPSAPPGYPAGPGNSAPPPNLTPPGAPGGPTAAAGGGAAPPAGARAGSETASTLCRLLALLGTPLGLAVPFDSSCLWATTTAWAVFATLAAVVQAAPLIAAGVGWSAPRGWTVGAVGTAALLLFWLLVALPDVGSNAGFTLTVAAGAAATGALVGPGRRL